MSATHRLKINGNQTVSCRILPGQGCYLRVTTGLSSRRILTICLSSRRILTTCLSSWWLFARTSAWLIRFVMFGFGRIRRTEQLRILTKSCLEDNMPEAGTYYADKLVTFSNFDREDVLLLAKVGSIKFSQTMKIWGTKGSPLDCRNFLKPLPVGCCVCYPTRQEAILYPKYLSASSNFYVFTDKRTVASTSVWGMTIGGVCRGGDQGGAAQVIVQNTLVEASGG